jgi:hypothetical protein
VRLRWTAFALALLGAGSAELGAQASAFSASLVIPGLPSPFVADWERNPQAATLMVNYTGTSAISYNLAAEIKGAARGVISRATSGPYRIGIGPTTQHISSTQLNCFASENVQSFVEQIVRTGVIPEDRYELTVRILSLTGAELARSTQTFTIALPDPPRLIFPLNGSTIATAQPNFQWMPVTAPPGMGLIYRIRVVEVLDRQTIDVALAANRPNLEQTIAGAASLLYPVDALELEEGKRYAWRVDAVDELGNPITSSQRRSESFAFSRGVTEAPPDSALSAGVVPDTIVIVPGVAQLLGTRTAAPRVSGSRVTFGGSARFQMLAPSAGMSEVRLENLTVDRSSRPDPTVLSGGFSGPLGSGIEVAPFVRLRTVSFTAGGAVRFTAQFELPGGGSVPLGGDVMLTSGGPTGTLTASGSALAELRPLGADPAVVRLTSVKVSLPARTLELRGNVELLGGAISCRDVAIIADASGKLTVPVNCTPAQTIPLAAGDAAPTLTIDKANGLMEVGSTGNAPAVVLTGTLKIGGSSCGAAVELGVTAAGAQGGNFVPRCSPDDAPLPLGWLGLKLGDFVMESLNYAPGQGFTFAFTMGARPTVAALPTLEFSTIVGTRMTQSGWTIGSVDAPQNDSELRLEGYSLFVSLVRSTQFTRAWTATGDEGFTYDVTGRLAFGTLGTNAPSCLANGFAATAKLAGGRLVVDSSAAPLSAPCAIPIGANGALSLTRLTTGLAATVGSPVRVTQTPRLGGSLTLPDAFECASGARTVSLGNAGFDLSSAGRLTGNVTGLSVACPYDLKAVGLVVTNATLAVDAGGDSTLATLRGPVAGDFGGATPVPGSGTATVNLVSGALQGAPFTFAGPFALGVPKRSPTLRFSVPGATLDTATLSIDGRGTLTLGGSSDIGVTFSRFALDTKSLAISGGSVLFDAPFALSANVPDSGKVAWRAVATGTAPGTATALRVDLPAGTSLDSSGIRVSGSGAAGLAWKQLSLAGLTAEYTDSTTFGVAPFAVTRGSVDLSQFGQRLAYVDAGGFHVDRLGMAGAPLPPRIALPTADVGFLDLAGTDSAAVRSERLADGRTRVFNAPGRTINLALPALGGAATTRIAAIVDITLDPSVTVVVSGTVRAAPGSDLSATGLPFIADSATFTAGANSGAWALAGRPVIFGAARGAPGAAQLAIASGGVVSGNTRVSVPGAVTAIPGSRPLSIALADADVGVSYSPSTSSGTYEYWVDGVARLALGTTTPYSVQVRWRVDASGAVVSTLMQTPSATSPVKIGANTISLDRLRFPKFGYSGGLWDIEIMTDVMIGFDAFPLLPPVLVEDATLTTTGLRIPVFSVPEFTGAQAQAIGDYELKPLAARSTGATLDWFGAGTTGQIGISVDLELAFPKASGALKDVRLSVLDAKAGTGFFTGTIERLVLPAPIDIALGTGGTVARVTELSGTLAQQPNVEITGSVVLATALRCGAAATGVVPLGTKAITLAPSGALTGKVSGLTLPCAVGWGPLRLRMPVASLTVGGTPQAQTGQFEGAASVMLPGAGTDTARASGTISVDVSTFVPVNGSLSITSRFRWPVAPNVTDPGVGSGPQFLVRTASLGSAGLTLTGAGAIRVGADSVAAVNFSTFTYGLPALAIASGSASTQTPLALDASIAADGALTWIIGGRWRTANEEVRVLVGANSTIDANGVQAASVSGAQLAWDARTLTPPAVASSDLRFSLASSVVSAGRIDFNTITDSVGVIDVNGFKPGSLFNTPAMPDRLLLPSADIAFIRLKTATGTPIAEALRTSDPSKITVRPLPGQTLQLTLAALGGGVTYPITQQLELDARTFAFASGALEIPVTGAAARNGITLTRIRYAPDSTGKYSLTADANAAIPASLSAVPATLRGIGFNAQGYAGTAAVALTNGRVANLSLGNGALTVDVSTLTGTFSGQTVTVKLDGTLASPLYGGTASPIPFNGTSVNGTWTWRAGATPAPPSLRLGTSTLQLTTNSVLPSMAITATAQTFALVVNGIWKQPAYGADFAYTMTNLSAGTAGYSATPPSSGQRIKLFGLEFSSPGGASSTISVQNGVVSLTLGGSVSLFGGSGQFTGLRLATDGSIATPANLLTAPMVFQDGALRVTSLAVNSTLRAKVEVKLPDPLGFTGSTEVVVGLDGTIQQKRLALRNEEPGLKVGRTVIDVSTLRIHTRGIWLVVKNLNGDDSQAEVITDVYLLNQDKNSVHIGTDEGGEVKPGYAIPFSGDPAWDNIELGDTVKVALGKLAELTLSEASAPRGKDFEIGFNGRFAIAMSGTDQENAGSANKGAKVAKGAALTFRDVYVRKSGVDFSAMAIDGGTLALMNGALIIDVARITFSDRPKKITVSKPPEKPSGMPSKAPDVEITVNYVLDFGGTICWQKPGGGAMSGDAKDCIMGGGVERVLYYVTPDGVKTLSIQKAQISVQEKLALELNFKMVTGNGSSSVQFAGIGQWGGKFKKGGGGDRTKELIIAGAIEIGTNFRVGAFIAVPVEFRAGPIVVEQVGAGFFWNPTADHIRMVREAAFSSTGSSTSAEITVEPAKFAVMLYGAAAVLDRTIVRGRMLVTISDRQFIADAFVTVGPIEKKMTGRLQLAVGFASGYAEGTLDVSVVQEKIVDAKGKVAFFAYSKAAWGVQGEVTVELFPKTGPLGGLIGQNIAADVFIGPRGFYLGVKIEKSFSISSIISITGGFKAKVWYYAPSSSWGGYLALYVDASIAGGIVTVNGLLEGALVGEGGAAPTFYAAGSVSASILCLGSVSASVWASIGSGGIKGGLGSNGAMEAALAKARLVRDEIEASKAEVNGAITAAKQAASSVALTNSQRLAIYSGMQQFVRGSYAGVLALFMSEAISYALNGAAFDAPYTLWYANMLRGTGLPAFDSTAAAGRRAAADAAWQLAQTKQSEAEPKVRAITATVNAAQAAVMSGKIGNPIKSEALKTVVQATSKVVNGDTVKTLVSGPNFDIDATVAQQAVATANAMKDVNTATLARVLGAAKSVDSTLMKVTDATTSSSGSLLAALEAFAKARAATEELYANRLAYLGESVLWTRRSLHDAITKRATAQTAQNNLADVWQKQYDEKKTWSLVPMVLFQRVGLVGALIGDASYATTFAAAYKDPLVSRSGTDLDFAKRKLTDTGMELWWRSGYTGLVAGDSILSKQIEDTRDEMKAKLDPIRNAHTTLTNATDKIFTAQGSLAGVAQDLYTIALALEPGAADKKTIDARLKELSDGLKAPTVSTADVSVSTQGLVSTITATWKATHGAGIKEYLFDAGQGLASVGPTGALTITRSYYDLQSNAPSLQLWARGGYGFRASTGRQLSITWPATASGASPGVRVSSSYPKLGELDTAKKTTSVTASTDKTAPSTPVVTFEGAQVYMSKSWAQPVSRVRAMWNAVDLESGITEYSIAVGSTPGGTDLTPWTNLGLRNDKLISELNLSGDKNVYVSVKAKNSVGLESPVGTSAPLKFDITPPIVGAPLPVSGLYPSSDAVKWITACSAAPGAQTARIASPPVRLFSPPGYFDGESGIQELWWKLSSDPVTSWNGPSGWNNQVKQPNPYQAWWEIGGPELTWSNQAYLSIAVKNHAGLWSVATTPAFKALDRSNPPLPNVCASPGAALGSFALRFGQISQDPESGIKGYQYRIVDATTLGVVRDWPGSTLDYTDGAAGEYSITPGRGGRFHVDVRAINKNDMYSEFIRTQNMWADPTVPAAPSVKLLGMRPGEVEYIGGGFLRIPVSVHGPTVTVEVNTGGDPETGIRAIQYMAYNASGGYNVVDWVDVEGTQYDIAGGQSKRVVGSLPFPGAIVDAMKLRVGVRVINRANGTSAVTWLDVDVPRANWYQR